MSGLAPVVGSVLCQGVWYGQACRVEPPFSSKRWTVNLEYEEQGSHLALQAEAK